jgi:hypothetical protein
MKGCCSKWFKVQEGSNFKKVQEGLKGLRRFKV